MTFDAGDNCCSCSYSDLMAESDDYYLAFANELLERTMSDELLGYCFETAVVVAGGADFADAQV